MPNRVKLSNSGVRAVLTGLPMQQRIRRVTEGVAENVRDMDIRVGDHDGGRHEIPLPVETSLHITDRAHGEVVLAHPAGRAVQAKHGALTKAARQAGLDVRSKA